MPSKATPWNMANSTDAENLGASGFRASRARIPAIKPRPRGGGGAAEFRAGSVARV